MDGIGLARALRQRRPDLPILLVSGYSSIASSVELEFTVLRKPFELTDLSRAMAKVMAEVKSSGADNVVRLQRRRMSERPKANEGSNRGDPEPGPGNVPA
jgi:ActR/RegA family two-component response regulator